jgi:hypothetical protein
MLSEELFRKYEDRVEIAYSAPKVHPSRVEKGDNVVGNVKGLNLEGKAQHDGWQIYVNGNAKFLTDQEYREQVAKIETKPEKDLPDNADISIVRKGQKVVVQPWSDTNMGVETTADDDGVIMTIDQKRKFRSWAQFVAEFDTKDHPIASRIPEEFRHPTEFRYVGDKTPVRYLALPEDVVVDFKEGSDVAKAGEILFENPDDVDGYTLTPRREFEKSFGFVQRSLPTGLRKSISGPAPDLH